MEELQLNDERLVPRRGSRAWKRMEWARFRDLASVHGGLTSAFFAQLLLGVSNQRVHQLMNEGRLPWVEIMGKRFIPCDALEAFSGVDRSCGFRYSDEILA